jgi:phosphoribosylaminoimidazole-succinocarboxamide synthase
VKAITNAASRFTFGLTDRRLILIDEFLTPNTARFLACEKLPARKGAESFARQYGRDFLFSRD